MRKNTKHRVTKRRLEHASHHYFFVFLFLFILLSGVSFYVLRRELSVMAWEGFRNPEAALFLSRDANLALLIGNYYFNVGLKGDYDLGRAQVYFRKAISIDPQVPDAWHQLARIDFLRGDFRAALEKINRQIELHGDNLVSSYYVRGLISGYAKNYTQAEADFKKFILWDDKNWAAYNDLSWIYFAEGKYPEAEATARTALGFDDKNPWLLNSIGVSLLNQDKKSEAKVFLLAAKANATRLSEDNWQMAYPGNDPRVASLGLVSFKKTIEANLNQASLVDKK